jgi:RNA polymerase sigma-70 factor, ECF subfamily
MQAAKDSNGLGSPANELSLLTRSLAHGDEEAFRRFHNLYFDRLYQFLMVVTRGQEEQAREALQETLLRVVRYVRVFQSEEAFWDWLKVVARNAARDGGRKRRRYLALLQNFAGWRDESEQPSAEDGQLQAVLLECLDELEPLDRQLVGGKYLDGSTVKELSGQTGLSEKAVESRLLRLRRLLRETILNKLRTP